MKNFKNFEQKIDAGVKSLSTPPQPLDMRKVTAAFKKFASDAPNDTASNQAPSQVPIPPDAPRYLLRAVGNSIVTFDLLKFATSIGSGKFSSTKPGAVNAQTVSDDLLVAMQLVSYLEEAARGWADPVPCVVSVDLLGVTRVVSAKEQQIWSTVSALPGVLGQQSQLSAASVLSNGDMFLLENQSILHSAYPISRQYIQVKPTAIRSSALVASPPSSFQLKPSKEPAIKAQRKGLFGGTGATDLEKIFSKTMEQRQKDELIGNLEERHKAEDVPSASDRVQRSTMRAKDVMSETRDAFKERGEIATRLASKTENLQDNARTFKEQTAALRDNMKQKEKRWGLF